MARHSIAAPCGGTVMPRPATASHEHSTVWYGVGNAGRGGVLRWRGSASHCRGIAWHGKVQARPGNGAALLGTVRALRRRARPGRALILKGETMKFWRKSMAKEITCRLCARPLTSDDWIRPWRLCQWPCHYAIISGIPWFRVSGMRADGFLQREGIQTEKLRDGTVYIAARDLTEEERGRMRDWRVWHMIARGVSSWSMRDNPGGSFRVIEAPLIAWYTTADVDVEKRREAWTRAEELLKESGDWGVWAGHLIDLWEARHEEASYWSLVLELLPDLPPDDGPSISLSAVVSS